MESSDMILITVGYNVVALRKSDGFQLWETPLTKEIQLPSPSFITLMADKTGVYAHTLSKIYRLDWMTGRILWEKQLAVQGVASIVAIK